MRIRTRRSEALTRFIDAKKAADHAKRELEAAEAELIESLRAAGDKSTSLTEGDKVQRATVVQTETTKIDEEGLRKALGVKLWNKVTVKKVDKAKLTAIIADGEISPELASGFLTVQKNKPYIRYSEGQRKDDEDSDE
jgi:hypothetical protein